MQTVSISTILSQEITFLTLAQQQHVLDYVRQLKETGHNPATTSKITNKVLLPYIGRPPTKVTVLEEFVGMFSEEDVAIMLQVMEERNSLASITETNPPHVVGKPMKLAEFREKFVGMFSKEDLEIMSQASEEDCSVLLSTL